MHDSLHFQFFDLYYIYRKISRAYGNKLHISNLGSYNGARSSDGGFYTCGKVQSPPIGLFGNPHDFRTGPPIPSCNADFNQGPPDDTLKGSEIPHKSKIETVIFLGFTLHIYSNRG